MRTNPATNQHRLPSCLGAACIAACFVLLGLPAGIVRADEGPSRQSVQFFESNVRPLLAANCYRCHGPQKQRADLRLDSRDGLLTGGVSGPAIVPGKPEESLLVEAISHDGLVMPPDEDQLSEANIAILIRWIAMGAPWPAGDEPKAEATEAGFHVSEEDRAYWAFLPVQRPGLPSVSHADWADSPIDAFVLARLEERGLTPNLPATKRELARRAYFDLIGLPPTPREVAAFLDDDSTDAYARLIDQLLARPEYGERWGRYWLDLVRFAETNGYERDSEKPFAWRYRDYIIDAFNNDKPYDRFVMEQLAGDELRDADPDSITATGFYRLGVWDDEPDDQRMAEFDELDDIVQTTSTAFLGLTVGCARCHDHMFDPIAQRDYYQLLAFFRNVKPYGVTMEDGLLPDPERILTPLADENTIAAWQLRQARKVEAVNESIQALLKPVRESLFAARLAGLSEELRSAFETAEEARTSHEKQLAAEANEACSPSPQEVQEALKGKDRAEWAKFELEIKKLKREIPDFPTALSVREEGAKTPITHLLLRGNPATPGDEVVPAFPAVLTRAIGGIEPTSPTNKTTGLRRELAEWIADANHPLTARVMVNRVWQHHFGTGIVPTPDDFGRTGLAPTHPELLDWLAAEFIDSGWSIKHLHRLIMLTRTYQLSSRAQNEQARRIDPANSLLWRQNLHRLDADSIRDSILAVNGTLNPQMGGAGFFPRLGREVIASASRPGAGWYISSPAEQARRSIYTFIKRTMLPPTLEAFDYTNTAQPTGSRSVTTVAPQALLLLNSHFALEQASALADRLLAEAPESPSAQVQYAYELAFGRVPTQRERELAVNHIERERAAVVARRPQLVFAPEMPVSLERDFKKRLGPKHFLSGPARDEWSYSQGQWQGGYSNILNVNPKRGPFALWTGASFVDGRITMDVILDPQSDFGSLIVRGRPEGDHFAGYEVQLNPRRERIEICRHGKNVSTLGQVNVPLLAGAAVRLEIHIEGPKLTVWLDGEPQPIIEVTDPEPILEAGYFGACPSGESLCLESLTIDANGKTFVDFYDKVDPARHSLQSFALVLFNLNEFLYVD